MNRQQNAIHVGMLLHAIREYCLTCRLDSLLYTVNHSMFLQIIMWYIKHMILHAYAQFCWCVDVFCFADLVMETMLCSSQFIWVSYKLLLVSEM